MSVFSKALSILSMFGCPPLVLLSNVLYVISYLQKNIRYAYELNYLSTAFCAVSKPGGGMKLQCLLSSRNSLVVTSSHNSCHCNPIKIPPGSSLRAVFRHSTYPVPSVEIVPQSQPPPTPHIKPLLCISLDQK